jgi:penicillin-binding protein 1A
MIRRRRKTRSAPLRSGKKGKMGFRAILLTTILLLFSFFGGLGYGVFRYFQRDLPSIAKLEMDDTTTGLISRVYSSDGKVIHEFYEEKRIPISLQEIPDFLKEAVIAVEDRRFYKHWGVDFTGILRAFWVNFRSGEIVQGGSTITQQLARNLFLTTEKTLSRKIREAILALEIERTYSKDEILEMYFNQVYFGAGAYGIEAAAQTYFGKHASELTLDEGTLLAGIPRWPSRYSPYLNLQASLARRATVLDLMVQEGDISPARAESAKAAPVVLKGKTQRDNVASYFIDYIRQDLENRFGYNQLYRGGLNIYTTLNYQLQQKAMEIMEKDLQATESRWNYKHVTYDEYMKENNRGKGPGESTPYLQGALVAIEAKTGHIIAMIGGRDYSDSKFNRVTQARRQPGSVFKPFVYTAAIDNGIPPSTIIIDSPISLEQPGREDWRPTNYDDTFQGPTPLRVGLKKSINLLAIKLLLKIGIPTVVEYAKRMGIKSPIPPVASIAIGSASLTPMEVTSAFSIFPNQGVRVEPIAITRVENREGEVLWENKPRKEAVLSPQTAYIMTSMLQDVVASGTGRGARLRGLTRPAGGKTGTTNDFTDAWFVGFTPDIISGVWTGFDQPQTIIKKGTGARVALPIWTDFMIEANKDIPPKNFPVQAGIISKKVCSESGLLATESCPRKDIYTEVFIKGTEPTLDCDIHQPTLIEGGKELWEFDRPSDDIEDDQTF